MELKITAMAVPEQIITFNYEELKTELSARTAQYETMVYGEDQIKEAKRDRANLNALKKALNDERLRKEKEYMQPFNQFKSQIAEIIQIIDKASASVDKQVKAFEEKQKADKLESIRTIIGEIGFPVTLDMVFDPKWLNASTSLETVKEALETRKAQIMADMEVIDALPEFALGAKTVYLKTLDLGRALTHAHDLAEMKAREDSRNAKYAKIPKEQPKEEPAVEVKPEEEFRSWIKFQALLSKDEAIALGAFLKSNGIRYKAI